MKTVLLAPLDPVHDNAVKLIDRKLREADYATRVLPPGSTPEEVIAAAIQDHPHVILISRTLGYGVAELLSRLVDMADAAGLRETTRLGVGGMAITRENAAEMGFDAVFEGELNLPALIAFIEGRDVQGALEIAPKPTHKPDLTDGYTYQFRDARIQCLLNTICDQILEWCQGKTSPGIRRAELREQMLTAGEDESNRLRAEYIALCDPDIQAFYHEGTLMSGVHPLARHQLEKLPDLLETIQIPDAPLQHGQNTRFFSQYGTGCPVMDVVHIKTLEAWGVDGVLHFDPSWGAQREGLLEGFLTHSHDGTILTLENLSLIKRHLHPSTLWNVRGHRGLNTPETQVIAHAAGADLFKINIPYGATAGGTDPQRLTVDGVYSLRLAARWGIPFDIPGNDELSGVPPHKTFAGLLVMTALGLRLGARPIPKPLMCLSPFMTITGLMDANMIDMNTAKLTVWQDIIDTPLFPGEPVGFMTHTSDRVQSAMATAAHAALAASLGMTAATIASTDEAYSRGPISAHARVDTLRAVRDILRFVGDAGFSPTPAAERYRHEIHTGIVAVLEQVAARNDFVESLMQGDFGDPSDGLYPGRTGKGTVGHI